MIGADGNNVGVVDIKEALRIAEEADLDLVEVSPNADPPVCRVMDFGKFLYERTKREREARKAQVKVETKEIRLRPKTNEHHRSFKTRDAHRWLNDGMKVKVTVRFRGREITYPELALEDLKEIAEELSDVGVIEQRPNLEGRVMTMVIAPLKEKKKKKPAAVVKKVKAPKAASEKAEEIDEEVEDIEMEDMIEEEDIETEFDDVDEIDEEDYEDDEFDDEDDDEEDELDEEEEN